MPSASQPVKAAPLHGTIAVFTAWFSVGQGVATGVLQQLHSQRESIERAKQKQQDVTGQITQAQAILGRMGRWFS